MKKRLLFIGSSTEGMDTAQQLQKRVDECCGDWIHSVIWNEGAIFTQNKNALDSLLKASRKFDYGVLVATNDDIIKSRGVTKNAPRDNVMLEMGMFLGSLGLTRAFLLVEEDGKLPTDFNGVTAPYFHRNLDGSLDNAVNKIIDAFNTTKRSYNIKPVPSAALALGYFDNFVETVAVEMQEQNKSFILKILLPKNIKNIEIEKRSYKNSNPSKEVSIFDDGRRPLVYKYDNELNCFWDIPTNLSTLNKLIDMILPSAEIGFNQEKQEWIDQELRTFEGTINALVQQCVACKGRVQVSHLSE